MKTLLIQGFNDAWRGLGAALHLFWPVLACVAAMWSVGFLLGYYAVMEADNFVALIAYFFIALCALIYVFFALCQGAVGWHRRLILGEAAKWISPLPRRRAFQYAWAVFLFCLAVAVLHIVASFAVLPLLQHELMTVVDVDTSTPPIDQLETWRLAFRPILIAMFAVAIAIFWLALQGAENWLLIYPHISIREGQPAYAQVKTSLPAPHGLIGALLISYFLPSVPSLFYGLFVPMSVQSMPWVGVSDVIFQYVFSAFFFLVGLSILSRAYVIAAKGNVIHQESHAVPT